jgi:hypothetical protein
MKRLKYLFAGVLLLLSLPIWRLLDWANLIFPVQFLITGSLIIWAVFCVVLPLKLLIHKMTRWHSLLILLLIGSLSITAGPFTSQATLEPTETHCGRMSYAGFFYPIREILSNAHHDDLEVRNQICWLVKMMTRIPADIPSVDLANHLNLMKNKLMKPAQKYRASLPWIAFLLGKYLTSSELRNSQLLVQNLGFWSQLYSEEISSRKYGWYEWPHSFMIQMEYGFIERNWENIQIEFDK